MDHTGSEEGKQPARESGTPRRFSAGDEHATGSRSEQDEGSERARRAFELLERFSGELEEILSSLERARGNTAPVESRPPAPEQTFSPSSIHFDPGPISARIDPGTLPPVESPRAESPSTPRLMLEVVFLLLVAAISVRIGLRPLLIVAAEAVAFLIVASVEIAIARDRRRYLQFPASPPTFTSLPAQEAGKISEPLSVTLDQVEPLIWQAGRHEDAFETIWPLAPIASPSEPDDTENLAEIEESATEISTPAQPESAAETTVAEAEAGTEAEPELEAEILAPESEPEQRRHVHLFRHEAREPIAGPETEAEVVLEGTAELPAPEREPEARGRFHLFARVEKTPEVDAALEAEIEHEAEAEPEVEPEPQPEAEVEPEPEPEYEPAPEILAPESEPEQRRHIHLFRHEAREPVAGPEPETEAEVVLEGTAELPAPEREPEAHGRFHLFARVEKTPEVEAELEAEIEPEPQAEVEPEAEAEPEPQPELEAEILAPESEPEQRRHIHLFRHEAQEPISEAEAEPEPEMPDNKEAPLEIAGWRIPAGEPDSSTGDREATIEIDLPPEISIAQIERTLEELGRREPGLRRRLWQRGAAENDATARSANEEALDGESELCLTAELERRRREREYLRSLRASR